ncbi:hypothetical protein G7054_g11407 [Neopestalotiopsis clavispora]|nr:hypothetical protein G7054_g11407 [Neopestalotiopsis clavispora]
MAAPGSTNPPRVMPLLVSSYVLLTGPETLGNCCLLSDEESIAFTTVAWLNAPRILANFDGQEIEKPMSILEKFGRESSRCLAIGGTSSTTDLYMYCEYHAEQPPLVSWEVFVVSLPLPWDLERYKRHSDSKFMTSGPGGSPNSLSIQADLFDLKHPKNRRGRGARKNNAYWTEKKSEIRMNPFDNRELLFKDEAGRLKISRVANLDTQLKFPEHSGHDLVISTHCARDLGLLDRHSTAMRGIVRNVQFRLRGTSVTIHRDFWVCDALNDVVPIMIGASFIAEHFDLLFEKAMECICKAKECICKAKERFCTFAAWFSKKKETPEQKAEREERQRQKDIEAKEMEIRRLRAESDAYQRTATNKRDIHQGGEQREIC